ncbi:MAG: ATP-binding protein [Planctomycetota bacterium]|jgi:signal transduction histidine kinase
MNIDSRHTRHSVDSLIERYFADPDRTRDLVDGETLMQAGDRNDRLYYVVSGCLNGVVFNPDGDEIGELDVGAGDFVGIQSFFSPAQASLATLKSVGVSRVCYLTLDDLDDRSGMALMPLFADTIVRRQQKVHELSRQEATARAQAADLDRLSVLGEFAAGVAHELNNAMAVLAHGAKWVGTELDRQMQRQDALCYRVFNNGMIEGRDFSASDVRRRARDLADRLGLRRNQAKRMATLGIADEELAALGDQVVDRVDDLIASWELGATFRDMQLAAEQAASVIESMKNLGAAQSLLSNAINLGESVRTALSILRNVTKGIDIVFDHQAKGVDIHGNKGELVQIWTNLVKNACDALREDGSPDPQVVIRTASDEHRVTITVSDNGPGIPAAVLPKIFLPNFTTKKRGLSFGLGIGLSIVRKIITGYGGTIHAGNGAHGAEFVVVLPLATAHGAPT